MHALHVPLRAGWKPTRVFAHLNKIVTERPTARAARFPARPWDNGSLYVDTVNPFDGQPFPMTYRIYRIAPGETDTVVHRGARDEVQHPVLEPQHEVAPVHGVLGGAQTWQDENLGYETIYKTITGSIFEFGFSDMILQMWAAFMDELSNGKVAYGCVRPRKPSSPTASSPPPWSRSDRRPSKSVAPSRPRSRCTGSTGYRRR
jgi:hypothetical protein